jgi:hypothetical protein
MYGLRPQNTFWFICKQHNHAEERHVHERDNNFSDADCEQFVVDRQVSVAVVVAIG